MARVVNRAFGIGRLRRTQLQQRIQEQQVLLVAEDVASVQTNVQDLNTAVITVFNEFPELGDLPPGIEP
jgi:hypothetical protein